ncbi:MAG TPA: peptidoglycan DD-metalloendopeptidase family protein [Candidatus Methylomirabilis sp.]|nr:peptidoglycan DD-metalloendopeptidase family protein [Candidatus Methylomirabilis sp.]
MKKGKVRILLAFLCLLGLTLNASTVARGMTDDQVNDEIKQLNQQISDSKGKMTDYEKKKAEYAKNIADAEARATSLKNEMDILDNRIAEAEIEIAGTQSQIEQSDLEIKKIGIEIDSKKTEIEKEKNNIATTLKLIYKDSDETTLEVLLMNNSLTDFLNRIKYLEDVNQSMGEELDNLKRSEADLESQQIALDQKNKDLKKLEDDLEQNKLTLEADKADKEDVLAETKDSESQYQGLVAELKRQQDEAAAQIADLEKTVREKIASQNKQELQFNDNGFIWPVTKNTITTYFHDPDYPFRYLFEHPGVDIRAAQGSTIYAAASGYVAHAQMNGTAYAYVMIIHGDGLSTVYGHVNKILVAPDDYVVQGQPIALSGGMPGTLGSGPFTTGPHLHFEVRKDGVPVDPLEYLPQ